MCIVISLVVAAICVQEETATTQPESVAPVIIADERPLVPNPMPPKKDLNPILQSAAFEIENLLMAGHPESTTVARREQLLAGRRNQIEKMVKDVSQLVGKLDAQIVEVTAPNGLDSPWLAVMRVYTNLDQTTPADTQREITRLRDGAKYEIKVLREKFWLTNDKRPNRKPEGGRPPAPDFTHLNAQISQINSDCDRKVREILDRNQSDGIEIFHTVTLRASAEELAAYDRGDQFSHRVGLQLRDVRWYTLGVSSIPLDDILKRDAKEAKFLRFELKYEAELLD